MVLGKMVVKKQCSFYRSSETLSAGRGIGYCELDGTQAICDGDINFCEKPDALTKRMHLGPKEEKRKGEEKKCPLFRQPEALSLGKGIGYCEISSGSATCVGDVKSCEKPDALKRYLQRKLSELENKENKGA